MSEGMVQATHWPLIWAAYAITFAAIGLTAASIWWTGRRRAAALARLEAQAPRERARLERNAR